MTHPAPRAALVTGAGGALGAAIAQALAGQGLRVLATDIDAAAAAATADAIGPSAIACRHDVTQETDWQSALALAEAEFGALGVLVNNAGIATGGDFETVSLADWQATMAVSAQGVFLGCRMALPLLRRGAPAAIVNLGSAA
ncbi:MAG TPA: SDR family NAD(P)-dependent oxidoreductase, partial [Novosphingobium sp.]|nr:SDR family NAD(P)-dependent oxidoreductase [Novosphingobium sp.]